MFHHFLCPVCNEIKKIKKAILFADSVCVCGDCLTYKEPKYKLLPTKIKD